MSVSAAATADIGKICRFAAHVRYACRVCNHSFLWKCDKITARLAAAAGNVDVVAGFRFRLRQSARVAPWGELLSTAANVRGAAGALMDGCTRDTKAIKAMGFPVFHGGIAPFDIKGRRKIMAIDVPIECAGAPVRSGRPDLWRCGRCGRHPAARRGGGAGSRIQEGRRGARLASRLRAASRSARFCALRHSLTLILRRPRGGLTCARTGQSRPVTRLHSPGAVASLPRAEQPICS